jgi:branched-chain amino acid transport system permease protein
LDILQLIVSGLANGCVYGLIALGFVLIYKATEAVNFAQGDFMMLGAFVTLGLTNTQFMGLPFWLSVPLAVILMGIFGYLLDLFVLRRMFGQSQIAMVILTIALGFVLRFAAGLIWGHEPLSLESPIAGKDMRFGGLVLGLDEITVIAVTLVLTLLLYFYFNRTRPGIAMQAASQNQLAAYYSRIPVRQLVSVIWAIAALVAMGVTVLFSHGGGS